MNPKEHQGTPGSPGEPQGAPGSEPASCNLTFKAAIPASSLQSAPPSYDLILKAVI